MILTVIKEQRPVSHITKKISTRDDVKLSIIIPTYNEKDNLRKVLYLVTKSLVKNVEYEIVVVDDNSPDGTGKIADEISNNLELISVIHRPKKMGLTSAIIDGFAISKGEFIGVLDADLQHSPEVLQNFFNEIELGADLVIASRYIKGGNCNGWNIFRKIVSRSATSIAHIFLPKSRTIMDPLSGFFIFKKKQLCDVQITGIGCKILLEIIVNCNFKKIVEVPYSFKKRAKGSSKLGFQSYIDFLKLIHVLKKMANNI